MLGVAPDIFTILNGSNRETSFLQFVGHLKRGERADPGSDGVAESFNECSILAVAQPQVMPVEIRRTSSPNHLRLRVQ